MPRPRRSESFYIKLSPQMSQVISLATKASISRPSPTACNTSFPTLPSPVKTSVAELRIAVEDTTVDTDDEAEESEEPKVRRSLTPPSFRPSFEQLCSAVPCSAAANPYAKYQPKRPSPLRRITNKPLCGSALFSSQSAMLPLFTRLEADNTVPDRLYPRSHPRTPLFKQAIRRAFFAGPCGPSAKKFGVRGAWEVERDIQRAIEGGYCGLVNDFELQVSPTRASFKPKLRLLTKCDSDSESSSSDEEDEEGSSGSDGSEEYGPSGFFESSSSEEDEDGDITDVSWEDLSH